MSARGPGLRRRTLIAGVGLPVASSLAPGAMARPASRGGSARAVAVPDVFVPARSSPRPDGEGLLGARMRLSARERLGKLALDDILAPYVRRPGEQEWAGEHVGKFLDAAVLSLEHSPDPRLRARLDHAARTLLRTQLRDGYLGTYTPDKYWTAWDVWSHKYNLIGLIAYHRHTGDPRALAACHRVAELLGKTFGDGPGQLDIVADRHSTHVGMAATSVLEPMARLYQLTGNPRHLAFCEHLLAAWERPHGPRLLSSLTSHGNVFKTANGKAYEMLSCLVGLTELHRATGHAQALQACRNAWDDVVAHRQYVIGTASWAEHFEDDGVLTPGGGFQEPKFVAGGEGCVTVTWQQLNWQLLRLTGDVRYAEVLERIAYNALIGAQSPDTGQIAYFCPLIGRKRYGEVHHGIRPDICCCASSQPRGIALLARSMAGSLAGGPAVLLYEPALHDVALPDGRGVRVEVATKYPLDGAIALTVRPSRPGRFPLRLRIPAWAEGARVAVAGGAAGLPAPVPGQWLVLDREWGAADVVELELPLPLRSAPARGRGLDGQVFVERGPQVLASDENVSKLGRFPYWGWIGSQLYRLDRGGKTHWLVPFADAGQTRGEYSVPIA